MKKVELMKAIEGRKASSAWSKGVKNYAIMLLESFEGEEFYNSPADKKALLNGANDWAQYSEGGCALIYDEEIAEMVCTPSELKKTKNGQNMPNKNETWIDVQTRALTQAAILIGKVCKN